MEEMAAARRMRELGYRRERWKWSEDANGRRIDLWNSRSPGIQAYVGTKAERMCKSVGNDSRKRRICKYSPNKSHSRKGSYHWGRQGNTPDTREYNRRETARIIREIGWT